MSHKRSKQKLAERTNKRKIVRSIKTIIRREAWYCQTQAETICRSAHADLVNFGYDTYKHNFSTTYIPDVDKGTVLKDTRSRGAFQSAK